MSIIDAARHLRDQFKGHGNPCPWHECMRIAAQCKREANARDDAKRAAWFAQRRQELRGERWRQRVRQASVITPAGHDGANGREGGWCAEYCEPTPKEDAA